jgi:hypothetical protein
MLPVSGSISISQVSTEVGAAAATQRALSWIQSNSALGYKDLGSIRGLYFFAAVSSKNSISRTTTSTTANCAQNCASQANPSGFPATYSAQYQDSGGDNCGLAQCVTVTNCTNCNLRTSVNCNQCGYAHGGGLIQANCNCNCNCYNCNCNYNNCNCDCVCACACSDGS